MNTRFRLASVAAGCLSLLAWGCGGDSASSSAEPVYAVDVESLPFRSLTDVVTYADFVAVVDVTDEVRTEGPGGDGGPEISNRKVDLRVVDVVWASGRVDVPDTFELTYGGWIDSGDGERRMVSDENSSWPESGDEYLGAFVDYGGGIGLLNSGAFFEIADDGTVVAADRHPAGERFAGVSVEQISRDIDQTAPLQGAEGLLDQDPIARFDELEGGIPPGVDVEGSVPATITTDTTLP